ncbi:MAG: hypothetical protein K6T51_01300 [Rubrobacteraceae bacterium]|nr:hypothetical protein [Rubrobacteraceae bacterium]
MDLTAAEVRSDAMPPASRGASDVLIERYLEEWERYLMLTITGPFPEDDVYLRGILRDLAGASAAKKVAADNDAYDRAQRQMDAAMERLSSYPQDAPRKSAIEIGVFPWAT